MSGSIFLENTPIAAAAAFALVALLRWLLGPGKFQRISAASIAIASALFWGIFAVVIINLSWDIYYRHFVPDWYRWAGPLSACLLYAALGVFFRWAALKLPASPVIWFCLLGGVESIPEHIVGIYRFKILEIPILAGSNPLGVFLFAFFEYIVYWSLVLLLAVGIERIRKSCAGRSAAEDAEGSQRS